MEGEIPIVDLGELDDFEKNVNPKGNEKWAAVAKDIRKILGEIGFMQLVNHGIPDKAVKDVFGQSQKFFQLPENTKMKYEKPPISDMESYYGYTKPGKENTKLYGKPVFELRESYDWIEGRGRYPDEELPNFEKLIYELHQHCKILAKKILRLWAIGLELDDVDFFIKKNQHWIDPKKTVGLTQMRLAHYPKIEDDIEIPEGSVRISEHTDYITLTLLFQDDVGGLEAKNSDGKWVNVTPIPGAIVCNTGDLLEFWTSGLFRATPHRVLIPESEIKKRQSRYSVVYFSGPDATETVTPLQINKSPEEEKRWAKIGKVYPSEPVNVLEHVIGKAKISYENIPEKL